MGEKKRPNIIYIMSDDHAANAVSAYHSIFSNVFKTPNMDKLGEDGCILDNYLATNAICTPARATVMTGQYGQVNGVRTLSDIWDCSNTPNLAQLIHDAGYQTGFIGKWHLHCKPEGFDSYKYLTGQGGQGTYHNPEFEESDGQIHVHEGYVTDIITDMTLNWLDNVEKDKPFFLMCHHKAPHDFWEYPERHEHMFDGIDIPVPDSLFEDRSHRSVASRDLGSSVTPRSRVRSLYEDFSNPKYVTGQLKVDKHATFKEKGIAAYQKYLKDYLRTVAGIDDSVGSIVDKVDKMGIGEDTIIIYTSDQGMYLGEHDYQDKRWSFDEGLRDPFLMRYPREIPSGVRRDCLMSNIDIAPTLLDYAGVEIPKEMQGMSCRKMLRGEADAPERTEVYFRYWMHLAHRHDNPAHFGVRTKDYKIVFYYGLALDSNGARDIPTTPGWELYDLKNDPNEMHNVYGDPKYAQVQEDMKKLLDEVRVKYKDTDEDYPEIAELMKTTK